MGFYERRLLPRLIHFGMRQTRFDPLREALVGTAGGRVLEIGIGSGLNLPFYRRDIETVIGIDPSLELLHMAKEHTAWVHFPVELHQASAEDLPLDDRSIDYVVMTWTLCSIADATCALAEIRRVLRPGGALLFIEHGQAPEAGVQRWQDRLTPLWRKVAGNCHLNRPIDRLIQSAGLRVTHLETGYMIKGPKLATFFYRGRAVLG